MFSEKIILQVLAEQKEEIRNYHTKRLVTRKEEYLFDFDSTQAQVVIGVRRSGKSTLCHKVLTERRVEYAYVNLDDDRLANLQTEDLNTVLSCVYQLYGTDFKYLFLDEIQDVDGWYLFVNRLLRTDLHVFVTGRESTKVPSRSESSTTHPLRRSAGSPAPRKLSTFCVSVV